MQPGGAARLPLPNEVITTTTNRRNFFLRTPRTDVWMGDVFTWKVVLSIVVLPRHMRVLYTGPCVLTRAILCPNKARQIMKTSALYCMTTRNRGSSHTQAHDSSDVFRERSYPRLPHNPSRVKSANCYFPRSRGYKTVEHRCV